MILKLDSDHLNLLWLNNGTKMID